MYLTAFFILVLVASNGPGHAARPAAPFNQTREATSATQGPPKQNEPSPERDRGALLLNQGDYKGAAEALRGAVKKNPLDAEAWRLLGAALGGASDVKGARNAFEKVLKLRPDSPDAHAEFAYVLLLLDKQKDAAREAGRALKLDPNHAAARYVTAALKLRSGKAAPALEDAEALLLIKPDFPSAAALAGEALLGIYVKEVERLSEQYPVPPGITDEATRKPILEKRDAALAPLHARMRQAAARLQAFADSRQNERAAEGWRELAETLRVYGRDRKAASDDDGPFRQAEVATKAVITFKPEPGFTEEARQKNVNGVVRLRAVLAADGRVRHILVLKGLPYGLTEKAVAAARQIRFTPARRADGQAVPQYIVLEYNFNVY